MTEMDSIGILHSMWVSIWNYAEFEKWHKQLVCQREKCWQAAKASNAANTQTLRECIVYDTRTIEAERQLSEAKSEIALWKDEACRIAGLNAKNISEAAAREKALLDKTAVTREVLVTLHSTFKK